jgi:uncharacterized protein
MTRLLFWIALIILVVMAIRSKLRTVTGARGYTPPPEPGRAAPGPGPVHPHIQESERMSCCAHCGVYFPSSEAVHEGGRDYCSPAHARMTAVTRHD